MTKVIYEAKDRSFLDWVTAKASGMKFTIRYIPIHEKYTVPPKVAARRRKAY